MYFNVRDIISSSVARHFFSVYKLFVSLCHVIHIRCMQFIMHKCRHQHAQQNVDAHKMGSEQRKNRAKKRNKKWSCAQNTTVDSQINTLLLSDLWQVFKFPLSSDTVLSASPLEFARNQCNSTRSPRLWICLRLRCRKKFPRWRASDEPCQARFPALMEIFKVPGVIRLNSIANPNHNWATFVESTFPQDFSSGIWRVSISKLVFDTSR